jgi:hypothetical protein
MLAFFPYDAQGEKNPWISDRRYEDDLTARIDGVCIRSDFFDNGAIEQEGIWTLPLAPDHPIKIKYVGGAGMLVWYSKSGTISPKLMWAVYAEEQQKQGKPKYWMG